MPGGLGVACGKQAQLPCTEVINLLISYTNIYYIFYLVWVLLLLPMVVLTGIERASTLYEEDFSGRNNPHNRMCILQS